MQGECPECGKKVGEKVYNHLFWVHSYTKDQIDELKEQSRTKNILTEANISYECDQCDSLHPSKWKLSEHKREFHKEEPHMQCPECEVKSRDHVELVRHVDEYHGSHPGEYSIESATFTDRTKFEDWKRRLEDDSVTRWSARCKKTYQNHTTTDMRCSRALPTPGYSGKNRANTKKVVRYCTAFMKVVDKQNEIKVEFCRRHFGHEEEPALLTMDKASEAYIVSLLKDGFKYNQVLKKVREGCRATDATHTRLYYTTTRDMRTIAIRNKVDPARRHDVDAESVEMRVREGNVDDGIRLYTPALAVQIYGKKREAVTIVAEGRWTVQDRSGLRYVEQDICICDAKLNNHCQKDGCGACAYAFRCECLYDSKSGVCCAHIHAVLLYGSEGRIHDDNAQRTTVSAVTPQTSTTSDAYSVIDDTSTSTPAGLYVVERNAHPDTDMLDHNKDAVQQIEAAMAALRADLISISKIASSAVGDELDKVLSVVTGLGKDVATLKATHCTNSAKRVRLARRADLPAVGRMPNPPPIRLAKRTTVEPKRQRDPIRPLPEYAKKVIQFCSICFRRAPATNEAVDDWLKCSSCEMWAHEYCANGEGSSCPYDEGTFQCCVVSD